MDNTVCRVLPSVGCMTIATKCKNRETVMSYVAVQGSAVQAFRKTLCT